MVNDKLVQFAEDETLKSQEVEELGALQAMIQKWPNEKFEGLHPKARQPLLMGWLRAQQQKLQPSGARSFQAGCVQ